MLSTVGTPGLCINTGLQNREANDFKCHIAVIHWGFNSVQRWKNKLGCDWQK